MLKQKSNTPQSSTPVNEGFALSKGNYKRILIGIAIVIVGFLLMIGGGSDDPAVFSEEIFSARRITIAPIVVLLGYGFIFYAILYKDKPNDTDDKPAVK